MTVLGSGAYGCVFKPALECRNRSKNDDKIGKVFFEKSAYKDEKKIAGVLKNIDPKQKYMLYPYDKRCVVEKTTVIKNDPVDECGIKRLYPMSYNQMMMNYGGQSLADYLDNMKTKLTRKDTLILLSNLFVAVKKLVTNKLAHQDIKSENVVVDEHGVARLIDFGLMTEFKDFNNNFLFQHEYFVNGPEYRLRLYMRNFPTIFYNLVKNLEKYSYLRSWEKNDNLNIIDKDYEDSLREFLMNGTPDTPEKADMYSIGVLIASMHPFLVPAKKDDKTVTEKFNNLLYGLLRPDPRHRMGINTALEIIKDVTSLVLTTPTPVIKNKKTISPKLPPTPKPKKECPPGKILNPKTNRCVKQDGNIAKNFKTSPKKCPTGKILNPKTNRCVDANGKIGKAIFNN